MRKKTEKRFILAWVDIEVAKDLYIKDPKGILIMSESAENDELLERLQEALKKEEDWVNNAAERAKQAIDIEHPREPEK